MGHLSLVHKFQKQFPLDNPEQFCHQVEEILDTVKANNMELDLDAAGLFKPDCQEVYPAPWIIKEAIRHGIPLIYGSDAHSVKEVGQGFDETRRLVASFLSGNS